MMPKLNHLTVFKHRGAQTMVLRVTLALCNVEKHTALVSPDREKIVPALQTFGAEL